MNNNDLKFASTLYVVPTQVPVGTQGINLEWQLEKGDGSMIEQVVPGCGCTADVDILPDRIVAKYNDNTKKEEVLALPGKVMTVSKNLRVFLKDGKPLKVKNERGVETYNQQKATTTLFFHVNVSA